jgi:inner membrane protein
MDSLSQAALGAAVAVAVMQRRTAVWKAAAFGAVAGTLPDLDVFVDHGDAVLDMVLHRAETHALFWLTLFSLPLGGLMSALARERGHWRRWWLAAWLTLITHPLLDAMTVYGTQLFLPFTNAPVGVGSVFIIDPAYTLPLLVGVIAALALRGHGSALRWNAAGLVLSTAYLGWGAMAQAHVESVARETLAAQGLKADHLLVTPTAFNTVAWRVVAIDEAGSAWREGYYSLLDAPSPPAQRITFDRFERGNALAAETAGFDRAERIRAFSRGFWAMDERDGRIVISDLRMGQAPTFTFAFAVAERQSPVAPLLPAEAVGQRIDPARALPWLWRRMQGERLPPPR